MPDQLHTLVVRDAAVTRMVPLDRDIVTIGRAAECTIRLNSLYVSRQHARIERHGERRVLIDLGSRNGSELNGQRVDGAAWLQPGDLVVIADATIECLAAPIPAGTTLPLAMRQPTATQPDLLRVDSQLHEVWLGDHALARRLSAQEFQLLAYLDQRRDRVCSRQELGDAVWGAGCWDLNMLHRLVHRLKEKLEPDPARPRYIQTVPQIGYRVTPTGATRRSA
jgi:pSer/pThr/pTyr-binding forkhead associated (FHA) protein